MDPMVKRERSDLLALLVILEDLGTREIRGLREETASLAARESEARTVYRESEDRPVPGASVAESAGEAVWAPQDPREILGSQALLDLWGRWE